MQPLCAASAGVNALLEQRRPPLRVLCIDAVPVGIGPSRWDRAQTRALTGVFAGEGTAGG